MLGPTRLIFQKSEMPKPSQGSVLGAIGFSVAISSKPSRRCSPPE